MPALTSANNPITANGTYTMLTDAGRRYIIAAAAATPPTSIAVSWLSENGVSVAFPSSPLLANGGFEFVAPGKMIQLVVTGWATNTEIQLNPVV